ncbi:MAG: tetratricopeptide repeat protein, partial [Myxococcales bacterium]|nr:tetratricopeptide repeat protein [Myxococcales bacterium]
ERALELRVRTLGASHPRVADTLVNLGNVDYAEGDAEEALERYQQALAIYEDAYGEEHPHVALLHNNIGAILQNQGRLAQADLHQRRALTLREALLGADHPMVARSLTAVSAGLVLLGRRAEAQEKLERALAIYAAADTDPLGRADASFGLAQLLWEDAATRPRALELAWDASVAYQALRDPELERLETWVRERREGA